MKNLEGYEYHECDKCKRMILSKFRINPYLQDVENKEVEEWICDDCYDELLADI